MNYVMSDLHGMFQEYREMLDKIHFSSDDSLHSGQLFLLNQYCNKT